MITVERRSDHEEYSKATDGVLLHVKCSRIGMTTLASSFRLTAGPTASDKENIPKSEVEVVPS